MAAPTDLTPEQRILRARMGAYALHAQGKTTTAAATRGFALRFEREVDPEGTMEPAERARRADAAMRSYMAALALKRSRAATRKGKGDGHGE